MPGRNWRIDIFTIKIWRTSLKNEADSASLRKGVQVISGFFQSDAEQSCAKLMLSNQGWNQAKNLPFAYSVNTLPNFGTGGNQQILSAIFTVKLSLVGEK